MPGNPDNSKLDCSESEFISCWQQHPQWLSASSPKQKQLENETGGGVLRMVCYLLLSITHTRVCNEKKLKIRKI